MAGCVWSFSLLVSPKSFLPPGTCLDSRDEDGAGKGIALALSIPLLLIPLLL